MSKYKRGTTNVIATMLIFTIMIASMAVLYSQISPTLFGYEAEVEASNQEFVMLSVANSVIDLTASSEGSQTRVSIVSQSAVYSVNDGYSLALDILDDSGSLGALTTNLGAFNANISSNFHEKSGTYYNGRVQSENSFITTSETEATNFISRSEFLSDSIRFSLYFKVRMELYQSPVTSEWDLSFIITKIIFQQANFDFPVDLDEWTLRLVRRATVVTAFDPPVAIGTNFRVEQTLSGTALSSVDLSSLAGETVHIKFIEVPILFSI